MVSAFVSDSDSIVSEAFFEGSSLPDTDLLKYLNFVNYLSFETRRSVLDIPKSRILCAILTAGKRSNESARWQFAEFAYRVLDVSGGKRAELPSLLQPSKLLQLVQSVGLVNLLQYSYKDSESVTLCDSVLGDSALLSRFLREGLDAVREEARQERSGGRGGGGGGASSRGPGPEDLDTAARRIAEREAVLKREVHAWRERRRLWTQQVSLVWGAPLASTWCQLACATDDLDCEGLATARDSAAPPPPPPPCPPASWRGQLSGGQSAATTRGVEELSGERSSRSQSRSQSHSESESHHDAGVAAREVEEEVEEEQGCPPESLGARLRQLWVDWGRLINQCYELDPELAGPMLRTYGLSEPSQVPTTTTTTTMWKSGLRDSDNLHCHCTHHCTMAAAVEAEQADCVSLASPVRCHNTPDPSSDTTRSPTGEDPLKSISQDELSSSSTGARLACCSVAELAGMCQAAREDVLSFLVTLPPSATPPGTSEGSGLDSQPPDELLNGDHLLRHLQTPESQLAALSLRRSRLEAAAAHGFRGGGRRLLCLLVCLTWRGLVTATHSALNRHLTHLALSSLPSLLLPKPPPPASSPRHRHHSEDLEAESLPHLWGLAAGGWEDQSDDGLEEEEEEEDDENGVMGEEVVAVGWRIMEEAREEEEEEDEDEDEVEREGGENLDPNPLPRRGNPLPRRARLARSRTSRMKENAASQRDCERDCLRAIRLVLLDPPHTWPLSFGLIQTTTTPEVVGSNPAEDNIDRLKHGRQPFRGRVGRKGWSAGAEECSQDEEEEREERGRVREEAAASRAREQQAEQRGREEALAESLCPICWSEKKGVAFQCGHCTCVACAGTLELCCICRQPITLRLHLY